jgi:hypothetical protein
MLKRLAIGICTLAAVVVMTSGSAFAGPPTKADVLKLKGKGYKGEIEIEKGKPVTVYYTIRGDGLFQLGYGKPGTSSYLHTKGKYEKKQDNVKAGEGLTDNSQTKHGYEVMVDPFDDFGPTIPKGSWHFMWVSTDEIQANFMREGASDDEVTWVKLERYN